MCDNIIDLSEVGKRVCEPTGGLFGGKAAEFADPACQSTRPTSWIETTTSQPHLPQEIIDYIVDLLQDERKTLKQCCLVSKSWLPRTRKYIFRKIRFKSPADPTIWTRMFPDPTNSPGHLADSLHVACVEAIVDTIVKSCDWVWSFSNVVRLEVRSGMNGLIFVSLS